MQIELTPDELQQIWVIIITEISGGADELKPLAHKLSLALKQAREKEMKDE